MTGDTIPGDSELGLTARAPREYRSEWLLGIGRRLRAEYTALGVPGPLPPRLAALVNKLSETCSRKAVNHQSGGEGDAPSILPSAGGEAHAA